MTNRGAAPPYYQVKEDLLELISELPAGAPIPTEREISERHGVSRTTVRKALSDLLTEGRISREQGRGTFIAEPKLIQELTLTGFTDNMVRLGLIPSSRLLSVTTKTDDPQTNDALDLPAGAPILAITRLRLADGSPMAIETVHLDAERFGDVDELMTENASLYSIMERRFNVILSYAEETIETAAASPEDAELLGTEVGGPILLLTRQSFDTNDDVIELVTSRYRGDRFRFATRLAREEL
ncbi:MAG: GntR family transcriptional regulator [Actinomycetota bacterium]